MYNVFSMWRDWRDRRAVFREIRQAQSDDREELRFKIKDELTYAIMALERDDHRFASDTWDGLMARHPAIARDSPLAIRVLIGLKRFEEAEALMRAGMKTHPWDSSFAKGFAEVAHARRDFDAASERWAALRKRFPGVADGFSAGADAYVQMGKLEQAEALALQAINRFPDFIGGPLEYARIAVERKDWPEALRRWATVRDTFGHASGYVGAAQALTNLGRYDEADALLQKARPIFGDDPSPLSEYARVAEARGLPDEAVKRWHDVLHRFPLDIHVHFAAAESFERLGEPAEAVATLRAAIERFRQETRPHVELAKLLQYQHHDYNAAAQAWADLRALFPDNEEAYRSGADVLDQAGRHEEAEALRADYRARFPR